MRIVISASREATEVKLIKDSRLRLLVENFGLEFLLYDNENARSTNDIDKCHVYFCEDHATDTHDSKQNDHINPLIDNADWVIVFAPLNHVGRYTKNEILQAVRAFHNSKNGSPVLTVFTCKDYYDFEENQDPQRGYGCDSFDNETKFSLEKVKELIAEELNRIPERARKVKSADLFFSEYEYDPNCNNLFEKIEMSFHQHVNDRSFRTQSLSAIAELGQNIKARDLYFDKDRARYVGKKYLYRDSVDSELHEAIDLYKNIVVIGPPGSGKTRAIYQLLHDGPSQQGMSEKNVVILDQYNLKDVFMLLRRETIRIDYLKKTKNELKTCEDVFLICDQINDVFDSLNRNEKTGFMEEFFDMLDRLEHVRLIAMSGSDAYDSFSGPLGNNNPLKKDEVTRRIEIPQISSDPPKNNIRLWINFNLIPGSFSETIGDCVKGLVGYKERIVNDRLFRVVESNNEKKVFLQSFMPALQIVETFCKHKALFLPVLVLKNALDEDLSIKEIVKGINYLIRINLIWVADPDGNRRKKILEKDFRLDRKVDDDREFMFGGEVFNDTLISTGFSYGLNEMVWQHLVRKDAERHQSPEKQTLLFNFNTDRDIVRAAKYFYLAISRVSTLRRILPRLPHTPALESAKPLVWEFCKEKCTDIQPEKANDDDYLLALSMLIGTATELDQVKEVLDMMAEKKVIPNYAVIGQCYQLMKRKEGELNDDLLRIINELRQQSGLYDDSIYTIYSKIDSMDSGFDEVLQLLETSKFRNENENNTLGFEEFAIREKNNPFRRKDLDKLFNLLAKKADDLTQLNKLLHLYQSCGITMRRREMRMLFSTVASVANKSHDEMNGIRMQYLAALLPQENEPQENERKESEPWAGQFADIIDEENRDSVFAYTIGNSINFRMAKPFYEKYYEYHGKIDENPRLLSMLISKVKHREFQTAVSFINTVEKRCDQKERPINTIVYNNLLKVAPNLDEALWMLNHIDDEEVEDYTISNILNSLKNNRKQEDADSITGSKPDPKLFFFAYDIIKRSKFKDMQKSPFVLGLLFEMAITPKQDKYVRDIYLGNIKKKERMSLVDLPTTIASIRICRDFRGIDEVWDIFNKCQKYYEKDGLEVNSELYGSMMRRLKFLCRNNMDESLKQRRKLQKIIEADWKRISMDKQFYATLYANAPDWRVFDEQGNISKSFKENMKLSQVENVKMFNIVLLTIVHNADYHFKHAWTFYQYIKQYYRDNNKINDLRPDIRTFNYLLDKIETKDDYNVWFKEIDKCGWLENDRKKNKMYKKSYAAICKKLGVEVDRRGYNKSDRNSVSVFERMKNDIDRFNFISPSRLNQFMNEIKEDNEKKAFSIKEQNYKELTTVLSEYRDRIIFNARSYATLIKLSPNAAQAGFWIAEMRHELPEDQYKYHMIVCREIATSKEVAQNDMDVSTEFFKYWENILQEIGFDPDDKDSFSEYTDKPKPQNSQYSEIDDYDYYWNTRYYHLIQELADYCRTGRNDTNRLEEIKRELDVFKKYGTEAPVYWLKDEVLDIEREIAEKLQQ